MRVECPNCGAKGEIDESKRPPGATSIRCPRCRESIPLDIPGTVAEQPGSTGSGPAGTLCPDCGGLLEEKSASCPQCMAKPISTGMGEISSSPRVPPATGIEPEPVARMQCTVCNKPFPREDMVRFGPSLVCAACKPMYVQMLEQGAARPGELLYAGFAPRFAAKFVDGLILFVVNMGISFLIGLMITKQSGPSSVLVFKAVELLLQTALAATMVTYFLGKFGATPGKMALGLAVVTPEGGEISYSRAFGRYFAEILSSIILFIGYLMVLFDEEKRALHDRICNTRVIRR